MRVLKTSLRALAHGKCVYCESVLDERTEPEIEHYVAKSVDPDRAFDWTNLLPACGPCNRAKGDQDHGGQLLKPDDEDPEEYLWINEATGEIDPMPGLDAAGTQRAVRTIEICKLKTGALCEMRYWMLRTVKSWVNELADYEGKLPAHLQELSDWLQLPTTPYKLVFRQVLTRNGLGELAEHDRRSFDLVR